MTVNINETIASRVLDSISATFSENSINTIFPDTVGDPLSDRIGNCSYDSGLSLALDTINYGSLLLIV